MRCVRVALTEIELTTGHLLILALGVALLVQSVWVWTAPSRYARWWMRFTFGPSAIFAVYPGLGLAISSLAVAGVLPGLQVAVRPADRRSMAVRSVPDHGRCLPPAEVVGAALVQAAPRRRRR